LLYQPLPRRYTHSVGGESRRTSHFHGSHIQTSNLDNLAKNGIEMTRFYTAPVSSPTRAGLMTGRYPNRFGIRETVIPPWRDFGPDTEEETLADMLGSAGYTNRAIIGKWPLRHSCKKYSPLERGFTHFYGHLNGAIDYFTHEREGENDRPAERSSIHVRKKYCPVRKIRMLLLDQRN